MRGTIDLMTDTGAYPSGDSGEAREVIGHLPSPP